MKNQLESVLELMFEYQKKHNIKGECIANSQYLFDIIRFNTAIDVKVKPVIVVSDEKNIKHIISHMVISVGNSTKDILDCSYEVYKLPNTQYFESISDFTTHYKGIMKKTDLTRLVENFLRFVRFANEMNQEKMLYSNEEYYNSQADYVEKHLNFIRQNN